MSVNDILEELLWWVRIAVFCLTIIALAQIGICTKAQAAPIFWEPGLRRADCALKVGPVTAERRCVIRVGVGDNGMLRALKFLPQPAVIATGKALVTDPMSAAIVSIRLTVHPLPGTLSPKNASGRTTVPRKYLPVGGWLTYCLLVPGCDNILRIPLAGYGDHGVGVGGILTVNGIDSGGVNLSLYGAPWNLGLKITAGGDTLRGFGSPVDGVNPISIETGAVQRQVTAATLRANSTQGPVKSRTFKIWSTVRFIPEPDQNLLLFAGILGLCVLGRGRMRRDG